MPDRIYKIAEVDARRGPPLYKVENLNGAPVPGQFYKQELQVAKVDEHNALNVERIVKERNRNGKKEALVKFKGYPNVYNEWILKTNIKKNS